MNSDGEILGFRKPDGTMASAEEYQADAIQYARNFAVDARMSHIHNHSHDCKATCFKYNQTKPAQRTEQDCGRAAAPQRQSCRFRFWRVIEVGRTFLRRLGKALVATPFVAHNVDDNNEYGRCIVRRHNCFRGSSNDLCQVSLRCNVDFQYQMRTFPEDQQQQRQQEDGAAGLYSRRIERFLVCFAALVTKESKRKRCWRVQLLQCDPHTSRTFTPPSIWRNRNSGSTAF